MEDSIKHFQDDNDDRNDYDTPVIKHFQDE